MARKRSSVPAYLLHKPTGQARCRIAGRDFYLGQFGSDASRIKYGELVARHAGGQPIDPLALSKRGHASKSDRTTDPGPSVAALSDPSVPITGSHAHCILDRRHS